MAKHEELRPDRHILLGIAGAALGIALLAILFGGLVSKVVAVIIALAIIQGLWRGAAELGAIVGGLIVAVPLAPAIGRQLEGFVGSVTQTGGLMARFLAIGLAAVLIVAIVGTILRLIARSAMKKSAVLRQWNPYLGACFGLLEGCLISLILLWAPLTLEPIARAQLQPGPNRPEPSPLARTIVRFADQVHESSLGSLAASSNPIAGTELMTLATDFAAVSRDREALAWLMEQPVMKEIESLPSVRDAVETVEADPELRAMLDDQGVSVETMHALLNSPRILELLDRTTIVSDMEPLAPRLAEAIRQARSRIKAP